MKKILSLVLVLVLVLGSMPVFADEHVDYGAWLQDAGLLKGDGDGNLLENETLTRAQMMVVLARLYGVEETAMNYSLAPIFTDVEANSYYAPFISYAYMQGWTNGVSATEFDPQGIVTAEQAATLLLRVLGYGDDFVYGEGLTMAASMGIATTFGEESEILRSELFELMYETVMTAPKGSDQVLGVQLGVVEPTPVAVEVVEVMSNYSLRQFDVMFNVAIDEDTLADAISSDDFANLTAELAADGMTVIFTFDAVAQDAVGTVAFEELASVDGLEFTADLDVQVSDRVNPAVVSAEMTSSKTLEITFSEIMDNSLDGTSQVWDDIKIDDAKAVGTLTAPADERVWTFEFNEKQAVGTHDILLVDFEDLVPFAIADFAGTVTVVDDSTAPYVVSIDYNSAAEVEVNFSEPVVAGTLELNGASVTFAQAAADSYTFDLTGFELTAASTYGENLTYSALEDVEGNVSDDDVVFAWAAPLDQTAPTVGFTLESDNDITVQFNEEVVFAAANATLLDADGDDTGYVPVVAAGSEDYEYVLTYPQLATIDPTAFTLEIEDVTDGSIIANEMAKKSFAFTTNDTNAPTISGVQYLTLAADAEEFRITFSEAMDVNTIANPENYIFTDLNAATLDGVLSDLDDVVITVAADAKSVDIVVPGAEAGDSITVLSVKDAAGTRLASANFNNPEVIGAVGTFDHTNITAIEATGLKTLKVTADKDFLTYNANDFVVVDAANPSATLYVTKVTQDATDENIIYLTLNSSLTYEALSGASAVSIYVDGTGTTDTFEAELTITSANAITVADKINPTVASVESTTAGSITITFEETVDAADADVLKDLIIRDSSNNVMDLGALTVSSIAAGSTTLEVTGLAADDYTVEILARYIMDASNNVIEAYESDAITVD